MSQLDLFVCMWCFAHVQGVVRIIYVFAAQLADGCLACCVAGHLGELDAALRRVQLLRSYRGDQFLLPWVQERGGPDCGGYLYVDPAVIVQHGNVGTS